MKAPDGLEADATLPWERQFGVPADAGICLSGGGIRSASFCLGVLQALQEGRGLLFGKHSARYLAVVSGGSYIAASQVLEAARQARGQDGPETLPPLAHGSPEEEHILSHGDYLRGSWPTFAGLALLNLGAVGMLIVWFGWWFATIALIVAQLATNTDARWLFGPDSLLVGAPILSLIVSGVGVYALVHGLYADSRWTRYLLPMAALAVLALSLPTGLEWLASHPTWWSREAMLRVLGGLLAATAMAAAVTFLARRAGVEGEPAAWLNRLTLWAPRALGFSVLAWSCSAWYVALGPIFAEEPFDPRIAVAFVGTLVVTLIFSRLSHSLHRTYRSRLASCFGIRRDGRAVSDASDALLTEVGPPPDGARRYPQLLVCATANARVRTRDGRLNTFTPLVFSHDVCGAPGVPGAAFPTAKLELLREPAGLFTWRKEPVISVLTSVAATGAAVSPSMGRKTFPSARMLIAAGGLRLGRWIPNPLSARIRRKLMTMTSPGSLDRDAGMGPAYNELIPEMFGLDGPRVYVSDGGHYDNLGLMQLLRAKCAEIWCVDASPERDGRGEELSRVLAEAGSLLGTSHDLDLTAFRARPDRLYSSTHVSGSVTYSDQTKARINIIKLGLASETPRELLDVREKDRGFPHHSTFLHQVYRRERMDAYRRLGHDSASRCLGAT